MGDDTSLLEKIPGIQLNAGNYLLTILEYINNRWRMRGKSKICTKGLFLDLSFNIAINILSIMYHAETILCKTFCEAFFL